MWPNNHTITALVPWAVLVRSAEGIIGLCGKWEYGRDKDNWLLTLSWPCANQHWTRCITPISSSLVSPSPSYSFLSPSPPMFSFTFWSNISSFTSTLSSSYLVFLNYWKILPLVPLPAPPALPHFQGLTFPQCLSSGSFPTQHPWETLPALLWAWAPTEPVSASAANTNLLLSAPQWMSTSGCYRSSPSSCAPGCIPQAVCRWKIELNMCCRSCKNFSHIWQLCMKILTPQQAGI